MSPKVLSVRQGRALMNLTLQFVHLKHGTFLQSSKDQWATKVQSEGWKGYWIPFKDQSSKKNLQAAHKVKTSIADIGDGCDLVMLFIHGGGMVKGNALMYLTNYRAWMKELQIKYGVKIGILTIEYGLSPENPYPFALNECVAAYRYLVEERGIDSRRIVISGQVLFSPWVMCPKPLKDSKDDYISNNGGRIYIEAYTQNLASVQTSQYAAPIRAATLAGLPRMLIFIGGVETLKPSIDGFVEKAITDGVQVEAHMKSGMPHDYALVENVSSAKIVREVDEIVGKFIANINDEYVKRSVAL
ncbi:hypothetical protein BGX21_007098 [Mortierella sp. AD011]|nr:hypothetical protein BGX21_007098 [Mortierella sp. AD011]